MKGICRKKEERLTASPSWQTAERKLSMFTSNITDQDPVVNPLVGDLSAARRRLDAIGSMCLTAARSSDPREVALALAVIIAQGRELAGNT